MNNNIEWVCVYKTMANFEAEAIKGNLEAQGIPAVILNKKDSSHMAFVFGTLEIHVDATRKEEALALLEKPEE